MPPASGNRSISGNTQDSSTPKNEITAKSRRKRRYSDTEGNGRSDGSPDGKRLASTRPGVGHDIRKAEPSPRNDLHPSSERAPTGVTGSRVDLLYNLGLFYRKLRDFERAKEFFRQAHEGCQSLLGSQHADTVGALEELNQSIKHLAPLPVLVQHNLIQEQEEKEVLGRE